MGGDSWKGGGGGGGSKGTGGGEVEVEGMLLNRARIAGMGVATAMGKGGGGAKYPSSPRGGVGGGLSAYDVSPSADIPRPLENQAIDPIGELTGLGEESSAVVASEWVADGVYAGGAVGTVPGKYLGTNGSGPCIGGPSSDPFVWKESERDASDALVRAAR